MAASVEPARRSIRELVIQSVMSSHAQQEQRRRRRKSLSWGGGDGGGAAAVGDDGDTGFWEEEEGTMELAQIGAERTKNVLILMSDTGGGHRASAEAIRDAFRIEFGDEYRVFVKDLFMEHAGWPLNDMERSYKFMVKHVQLWKVAFHSTSPRWVHNLYLAAIAAFYAKFQTGVNRCYCPSEEVAKRASVDGLKPSQIRVFGLPIRPSFCRAVLVKEDLRKELEMDPKLPAVLLMGGGEGMGPVKKTAKALGESLLDKELGKPIGQLVVVCGPGVFSKSSKQTASFVAQWFSPDSEELKKMSQNALKLAQPDAVFDIVKDIHELAQQEGPLSQISDSLTSSFLQPI
ncbi:hypothetical protein B296_00016356 [Ensete ventricosum]|uniref:Diacylglycerol glucosyltransferase N-terminal domain-containing protein n=1 Tax=Ensete ventricosum TaxID=4639 RepID=A0A426YMW6_ENSVE|nr:hypothetical protein B296_00016356 [Ensete ventricosum]